MPNQNQELDEILSQLVWEFSLLLNSFDVGDLTAKEQGKRERLELKAAKQRLTALLNRAEEKGREYSLNESLKAYLAGKQVDAMTMVRAFANIFIAVMCIDTNADSAEITLKDLEIMGKPVGTWKVKAELEKSLK